MALNLEAQQSKEEILLPTYNLFDSPDYTISARVIGVAEYHYTLKNSMDKPESFILYPNDISTFKNGFISAFDSIRMDGNEKYNSNRVDQEAFKVYYMFISAYSERFFSDKARIAGELCFENNGIPIQKVAYTVAYVKKEVRKDIRSFREQVKIKDKDKPYDEDSVKTWKCKNDLCDNYQVRPGRNMYRVNRASEWYYRKHFIMEYQDYLLDELNEKNIALANNLNDSLKVINDSLKLLTSNQTDLTLRLDSIYKLSLSAERSLNDTNQKYNTLIKKTKFLYDKLLSESVKENISNIIDKTDGSKKDLDKIKPFLTFEKNRLILDTVQINGELQNLSEAIDGAENILAKDTTSKPEEIKRKKKDLEKLKFQLAQRANDLTMKKDSMADVGKALEIIKNGFADIHVVSQNLSHIEYQLIVCEIEMIPLRESVNNNKAILNKLKTKAESVTRQLVQALKNLDRLEFKPTDISVEFNEGFIENIQVIGEASIPGEFLIDKDLLREASWDSLKFENAYPFGFSSKNDIDHLLNRELYTKEDSRDNFVLKMSDLLKGYYQQHEVNRRDYSPADASVRFNNVQGYCQELKKDETYKLLEAKIFSDFVGLESSAPNGLIQTEISREFRLYTKRWRFNDRNNEKDAWNYGVLSYIQPELIISKIENKNRSLALPSGVVEINGKDTSVFCATAINLKEYENLSVNPGELNVAFFDFPGFKSTLYFNLGVRFGRTSVSDSTYNQIDSILIEKSVNTYGINTFSFYPKVIWEVKTDEALGLFFSYSIENFRELSSDIEQVANYDDYSNEKSQTNWMHGLEFTAFFNPADSKSGRLFFRYRYTWMNESKMDDGFHQAQLGYSFFIFGNSKK
jgi:hypothetical protein